MRTWKKFLAVFLSAAMAMSLCVFNVSAGNESPSGSGGSGNGTTVAKIGETEYPTLTAALETVTGNTATTITLVSNSTENVTIPAGKTVTLDLNGKTLANVGNVDTITVEAGGSLTIIGNGTVNNDGAQTAALLNNGTAKLNGGTFARTNNSDDGAIRWYAVQNHGAMTIDGAAVKQNDSASASAFINGWAGYLPKDTYPTSDGMSATVTITSGTISGGDHAAKQCAAGKGGGAFIINGGTFTAGTVGESKDALTADAVITVNGGTFTGKINARAGGAITISNGSFTGDLTKDGSGSIVISGGKFSTAPASAYVASGSFVVPNTGNDKTTYPYMISNNGIATYNNTQYATVQAAVDAIVASGTGTVTMNYNSTEDVTIPAGKTVTLDLNGKTLTGLTDASEKTMNDTTATAPFIQAAITNEGTLIVTGTGTVKASGKYDGALFNKTGATATLDGGTFTDALSAGGCWYIVVNLGTMTINSGATIANQNPESTSDTALINGCDQQILKNETLSGYVPGSDAVMTINGGTFTSGLFVVKNGDWYAQMTINGGTFAAKNSHVNGCTLSNANNCPMMVKGGTFTATGNTPVIKCKNKTEYIGNTTSGTGLTISDGTFTAGSTGDVIQTITKDDSAGAEVAPILNISNGNFSGTYNANRQTGTKVKPGALSITGGYYTADPTAYLEDTLIAIASDKDNYTYMVGKKGETPAAVVTAAPAVENPVAEDSSKSDAEKTAANNLKTTLTSTAPGDPKPAISSDVVAAAANTVANNNTVTAATPTSNGKTVLDELKMATNDSTLNGDSVNIAVQTYMDIQIKDVSVAGTGEEQTTTLTLEITPMYQTVATTANIAGGGEIVTPADKTQNNTVNAVKVGDPQELTITKPVTVTLPLPESFAAGTLYVKHQLKNGTYRTYKGTVTVTGDKHILTFVNPDGFSEFVVSKTTDAAAEIGDIGYPTLQAAVDAVQDGQTINIVNAGQTATVNRTVHFTVTPNGNAYTINLGSNSKNSNTDANTYDITYTAPSSGGNGGGGASVTTYSVTVTKPTNGTLTSSVTSAASGKTVTLTAAPATGYVLDTVTVTDASGKTVTTTKAGDTGYTFTMPAANVTAAATFKTATPAGWVNPFTDVNTNDWFYDAVKFVNEKGLFAGTSDTTFSPNQTMTRGMLVTVLWRLEGKPAAAASATFTDVASGSYYATAVAWAAANQIVKGTSETTFSPNAPITREQMAAILYRYASYKTYDTTQGGMAMREFADSASISAYALTPMTWAVNTQLIQGDNGKLLPQGSATRAQVATILMRFVNAYVK